MKKKKDNQKKAIITQVKMKIHELDAEIKTLNKKADISLQNTKIAIKKGDKERAKSYLIKNKQALRQIQNYMNIKGQLDNQMHAIKSGEMVAEISELMSKTTSLLKSIAIRADPVQVAEVAEDASQYVLEIEEAANLLAGDPEIDSLIDVNDELDKMESQILLDMSMVLPDVPSESNDLQYLPEDNVEVESDVKIKEKLEAEIEKLRRELEE